VSLAVATLPASHRTWEEKFAAATTMNNASSSISGIRVFVGCSVTPPQLLTTFTVINLAKFKDKSFHHVSSLARELLICELVRLPGGDGAALEGEDALNLSSTGALQAKTNAVEMLRAATRLPLRDEHLAYAQIGDALQNAETTECEHPRNELEDWVYTLALIYAHQTGSLPAFSNCENETRFERFVHALPAPSRLRLTRNRLKAAIRRLNLKNNPGFVRDLNTLNSKPPDPANDEL